MAATWTETTYIARDPDTKEYIHSGQKLDTVKGDLWNPGGMHPHYEVIKLVTHHNIEVVKQEIVEARTDR